MSRPYNENDLVLFFTHLAIDDTFGYLVITEYQNTPKAYKERILYQRDKRVTSIVKKHFQNSMEYFYQELMTEKNKESFTATVPLFVTALFVDCLTLSLIVNNQIDSFDIRKVAYPALYSRVLDKLYLTYMTKLHTMYVSL